MSIAEHPLKGKFDTEAADWQCPPCDDGSPGEIEIGFAADGLVGMRKRSEPDGTLLIYTPQEWEAFVGGVQDGEFDVEVLEKEAQQHDVQSASDAAA